MRHALVIGGSLGGLMAAHLLRKAGWDAVVFERNAEELASRGVGLGTHPQLIAVMRRAGIAFDETMGIKVPKVVCLDRGGKTIVEQPTSRTMSGWARLYRALREALPAQSYRLGMTLRRLEQDDNGATKAAIDAATLADCLSAADEDIDAGLARFERVQQPFGSAMVALARRQGAYLSAQLKPPSARDADECDRDIDALLHAHGTRSDQIGALVAARNFEARL